MTLRIGGLIGSAAMLVVFLGYLSHHLGDPHYMNRMGSLVVCVSLGVTAVQFAYERQSERRLEHAQTMDPIARLIHAAVGLTPEGVRRHMSQRYTDNREWLFIYSVSFAIVGELLHGWGDLLLHYF